MSQESGYNNPPAFPCVAKEGAILLGMSLRDWFAGQALKTMPIGHPSGIANSAYAIADAMLKARVKESGERI